VYSFSLLFPSCSDRLLGSFSAKRQKTADTNANQPGTAAQKKKHCGADKSRKGWKYGEAKNNWGEDDKGMDLQRKHDKNTTFVQVKDFSIINDSN
jgi:hypothetical protein